MRAARFIAFATLLAALTVPTAAAPAGDVEVRAAITQAILARMGSGAAVEIRDLGDVHLAGPVMSAMVDPSARLGTPVWVFLFTGPATSVRVHADLRIVVDHTRAGRAIDRGHILVADDLVQSRSEVFGVPLRALPTASALVGARALRALAAGDVIQDGFVAAVPLVRSGAPVTAIARIGDVEVSAQFVATDSGNSGDIIRIINPETHRTLRARIVASALVEVVNVH